MEGNYNRRGSGRKQNNDMDRGSLQRISRRVLFEICFTAEETEGRGGEANEGHRPIRLEPYALGKKAAGRGMVNTLQSSLDFPTNGGRATGLIETGLERFGALVA